MAAAAAVLLLVMGAGYYFRPNLSQSTPRASAEEIAAVVADRRRVPDLENPPVIWKDVDYMAGPAAPWFPKNESPILHELVRKGELPSVAERTGPEPVVLQGVEGIGRYGGAWYRLGVSDDDISGVMRTRLSNANLVRWSPNGYPIVPHLAKSWTVSPDQKVYTFTLRRGVRWSDGELFTAADIMYWWKWENLYLNLRASFMSVNGKEGIVEVIDDLHVRFVFPEPNTLFLEHMAAWADPPYEPSHYLKKYHPQIGDHALIRATMKSLQLPSPEAVYERLSGLSNYTGNIYNPECPRMWPWIYRRYQASAPQTFLRNPYYFAVDPAGNQLPYLDRVVSDVKAKAFIAGAAAGGDVSMQVRFMEFQDYTLLAGQAKKGDYDLYHWTPAAPTAMTFFPNLNRWINPAEPATRWKHTLLNEKDFRRALSLALNRQEIIDAVYNGVGEPAQSAPGKGSPYFHAKLLHSFTAYDPARANALLDSLGLTHRDREGFRTFPDQTRMTFFLSTANNQPPDAPQLVADFWNKVGVRTIVQVNDIALFDTRVYSTDYDIVAMPGFDEFLPLVDARDFVPTGPPTFFAPAYGRWYLYGGMQGNRLANLPGCAEPPRGSDIRRAMELVDQAGVALPDQQVALFSRVLDLVADNVWTISFATKPPQPVVVKHGFRNVPHHALFGFFSSSPGNAGIETYFWDQPHDSPEVTRSIQEAILHPSRLPRPGDSSSAAAGPEHRGPGAWAYWAGLALLIVVAGIRHHFVWWRLLIMVPTLAVISVLIFTILQLPPGDFITSKIMQLEMEGNRTSVTQVENLKKAFHFDKSPVERYLYWSGLKWFTTFKPEDTGLLEGNLGRSMANSQPVTELLGDRFALTLLISFMAMVFVWTLAVPLGIFSAVKQYSGWDYSLTFLGFLGISVPPFLLALVLMFISSHYFDVSITGLFNAHYGAQPYWSWDKFINLLQRIWVPIIVLGAGSIAVMTRVMRANLLDELKKSYVTTARAKGMRPVRLLLKYPVRLAVNPFASGMGSIFPQLISGDAVVAIVLSLPTISPLLLQALMNQDTYLAASLLMLLSLLSVLGTLFSDLVLQWLDPRLRMAGNHRR